MKTAKGTDIFLRRCFDREHTIKIGLLICRHPFMERLGAMYLMRLRHGRNFSCDAGACWRILFVKGLMPWLEKYREFGRSRQDENDSPTIHED
mmetsp:Transcript_2817/g.3178  ORF Transcript_2817/g.3178 Transcript_2817/m.3178 type:complete len:93 (+) Transcript_2817:1845-2123(+)